MALAGLFGKDRRARPPGGGQRHEVEIGGRSVSVTLKPDARARRFILRMEKSGGGARVTVPSGATALDALDFVRRHGGWIADRIEAMPAPVPFAPGAIVPVRGTGHRIVRASGRRGTVSSAHARQGRPPELHVAGGEEHIARRLRDWLKREAKRDLSAAVERYAALLDVRYARISLRDQSSRWGSCSSNGTLSFSWRLILAPPEVLDYVAAHEAAHLIEMNHSPAFWAHVERVCPHTRASKRWLKAGGAGLHRYGAD